MNLWNCVGTNPAFPKDLKLQRLKYLKGKIFNFSFNRDTDRSQLYVNLKTTGHRSILIENDFLFPNRAWLEGNLRMLCMSARLCAR